MKKTWSFGKFFYSEKLISLRRSQFRGHCRKFIARSTKNFQSRFKNDRKRLFLFQKLVFPQTTALDTWNAVLTNLSKFFGKDGESVLLKYGINKARKKNFKMNFFVLKLFLWACRLHF